MPRKKKALPGMLTDSLASLYNEMNDAINNRDFSVIHLLSERILSETNKRCEESEKQLEQIRQIQYQLSNSCEYCIYEKKCPFAHPFNIQTDEVKYCPRKEPNLLHTTDQYLFVKQERARKLSRIHRN